VATREAFLATVRAHLGTRPPDNLPHPIEPVEGVPAVRYTRDLGDVGATFVERARRTGAEVRRVGDEAALAALVGEVVREEGVSRAVVSADPECVGVAAVLSSVGVEVVPFAAEEAQDDDDGPGADDVRRADDGRRADVARVAGAGLGVTGAAYGIAATGSLVLHSARAGGRSAGLLPPVHLGLVRSGNLLPDAGALFRHLDERLPGGPPSQLVLSSGPSRSGDIELVITIGVHGPGRVWVAVLDW